MKTRIHARVNRPRYFSTGTVKRAGQTAEKRRGEHGATCAFMGCAFSVFGRGVRQSLLPRRLMQPVC